MQYIIIIIQRQTLSFCASENVSSSSSVLGAAGSGCGGTRDTGTEGESSLSSVCKEKRDEWEKFETYNRQKETKMVLQTNLGDEGNENAFRLVPLSLLKNMSVFIGLRMWNKTNI